MIVERFLSWLELAPADERALAARALVGAYLRASEEEGPESEARGLDDDAADAVMTALVDDPASEVRMALAETLAGHADVPRHVVMSLAVDIPGIAATILARSPVFIDAELVERITGGTPELQAAIARRPSVSVAVAAALAETGGREACLGLLANAGAEAEPAALHRIAERFGEDGEIRRRLLRHPATSPRTQVLLIERLGGVLTGQVTGQTAADASLPDGRIEALARDNCDRAIIAYAARAGEQHLGEIVEAVIATGRMTATFLLRAICMGNISLFANGLSKLAKVPLSRVETILAEDRRGVFQSLYRKAELPDFALGVFMSAIDCWRAMLASPEPVDAARLSFLVTREVLSAFDGRAAASPGPQRDALFVLLRRLAAEANRHHVRREISRLTRQVQEGPVLALAPPQSETIEDEATEEQEIMNVPPEVINEFAIHFAEEIVDLEEELAIAARAALDEPVLDIGFDDFELSEEELLASLELDDCDEIAMPDNAANDTGKAPSVRAADTSMPELGPDQPVSVLVGLTRAHLRRRAA